MPQMKPMNWMLLYFTLNLILMFMNILNYFSIIKFNNSNLKISKNKDNLNWKW